MKKFIVIACGFLIPAMAQAGAAPAGSSDKKFPIDMNSYELEISLLEHNLSIEDVSLARYHLAKLKSSPQEAAEHCQHASLRSADIKKSVQRFEKLPARIAEENGRKADYLEKFKELKKNYQKTSKEVETCIAGETQPGVHGAPVAESSF